MNWHRGNIAEAVSESKLKDAIFVVYIEGRNDELSNKLESFLDSDSVREKLETPDFVAIKIQGDGPAYGQFLSLYKVVPIPSIFFIGKSGTPLEIATGITASIEELTTKIDNVLVAAGKRAEPVALEESGITTLENAALPAIRNLTERSEAGLEPADDTSELKQKNDTPSSSQPTQAAASTAPVSTATAAAEKQVVTLNAVATTIESANVANPINAGTSSAFGVNNIANVLNTLFEPPAAAMPPTTNNANSNTFHNLSDSEQRMTDVQNLLEEKKRKRQLLEERRAKENELRRRRESRETSNPQNWQKEQELKNVQERLRRNRQEEQEARERVRAQIAADRAEQIRRDPKPGSPLESPAAPAATPDASITSLELTRLQIRLPSGVHNTRSFASGEPLSTVRYYVRDELLLGSNIRNFTLATTYPRREFKVEDEIKTLKELNLVPNAVVLVLTSEQSNRLARSGSSILTMLATIMWAMLTPAAKAFEYVNKMGLQRVRQNIVRTVSNMSMFRQPGGNLPQGPNNGNLRGNMPPPGVNRAQPAQPQPAAGTEKHQSAAAATAQTGKAQPQSVQHGQPPVQMQEAAQSSAQFQQRAGGYQPPRYGDANIRRLQDNKKDDDKATYNGNSTQQQ